MTPTQSSDDVLSRLRELEARLNSLSGGSADVQRLREALAGHEQRRGKHYAQVLRQASTFAQELSQGMDRRIALRMNGVADRAAEKVRSFAPSPLDRFYDRAENKLALLEEEAPEALQRLSLLQTSALQLGERAAAAGDRFDKIWEHQEQTGLGAWRSLVRAAAAQVELEKQQRPAFTDQFRGQPATDTSPDALTGFFCSRCQATTVRRIRRESLMGYVLRMVFLAPHRCSTCGLRCYRFTPPL